MNPFQIYTCQICGNDTLKTTEIGHGASGSTFKLECNSCKCKGTITNSKPFRGVELPLETIRDMFSKAGIKILSEPKALPNGYYTTTPYAFPWWFIKTAVGWIEIGHRKRVIEINWVDTPIRTMVTNDNVTKDYSYVHAWTEDKAIEYLSVLGEKMKAMRQEFLASK